MNEVIEDLSEPITTDVTPIVDSEKVVETKVEETKPKSIRESLEAGFAKAKEEGERKTPPKGPDGRFVTAEKAERTQVRSARAREMIEGGEPEPEKVVEQEQPVTPAAPATEPPAAWPKEAKETWAQLPPAAQAAVLKREQDTQKGVDALKASYAEMDQALAPHIESIRRHGHSPGQAIAQLFSWFQALANNPDVAFPALAKSFNYEMKSAAQPMQPQAQQATEDQPEGEVPLAVQQYINEMKGELAALKQEFGQQVHGLHATFQQQSEAKTQELVQTWSKDKPHFEAVRQLMGQLIASGAVPLKEGRVDLDGAYEMAVYSHPEVRAKLIAEQQAKRDAEIKAKQEATIKAQQAAAAAAKAKQVSVTSAAPGGQVAKTQQQKKGTSVRESLQAAIDEVRGA